MREVPFVANSKDDLHCLQSAYKMIAQYFMSDFNMDWEKWSAVTGFEEGRGSWASAGLLWFKNNNFEVRHISLFDYDRFVEMREGYLIELVGETLGNWQVEHTNMPVEIDRARKLLELGIIERREPSIAEIRELLGEGWLVRVLINADVLNNKDDYTGHHVTITGVDDVNVTFHDPGLPPVPNRKVARELFEKAWAYPNSASKEMDAIRKRTL